MKNHFFIIAAILVLCNCSLTKSQYKGGAYDGYISVLDTNIRYPLGIKHISNIADNFFLYQNFPNPFNPNTNIKFSIHKGTNVRLNIFDITGKLVHVILDNIYMNTGVYNVTFDGTNLSSGIYFYQMEWEDLTTDHVFSETRKMIFNK